MPQHKLSRSKKKEPAASRPRRCDEESEDTNSCFSTDTDGESKGKPGPLIRYLSFLNHKYDGDPTKLPPSPFAGSLSVKPLPMDAWDKWCKDGVVCFGMNEVDMAKIYFANPRDLSVYHVVDFYFPKFGPELFANMSEVGHALIGSKIYVIGGMNSRDDGPLEAYCCDVASQPPLPGGGYEWMALPKVNTYKPRPIIFSLAGNIYVLSIVRKGSYEPFEVLKPGRNKWEVLDSPFTLDCNQSIYGSFLDCKNKKFLIHSVCVEGLSRIGDDFLSIYDAKRGKWTQLKFPLGPNPKASLTDIFSVEDMGLLLGRSESFVLGAHYREFETGVVKRILGLDVDAIDSAGETTAAGGTWHIVPLGRGTRRFCKLALYSDTVTMRSYARFGTFDLVQHRKSYASGDGKRKHLKLPGYKVANEKFKTIKIADVTALLTIGACSKVGAFSNC